MKKNTVILTIFLLFSFQKFQAQCPSGYVTLSSQADVDTFVATYPNCTEIAGDFFIFSSNDLSGLSQIVSVGRNLKISNCTVTDLHGFNQLSSVKGEMSISNNNNLNNLDGLEQLSSVGVDMWIFDNDNLTNLDGLEQLIQVGDDMHIRHNDKLLDLSGLNQLTTIGGSLTINGNDDLVNLDDLNGLQSIGGQLQMRQNINLSTVTGFSQIDTIGGTLNFYDNNNLTEVDGFEALNHIGSNINLFDNDVLTEFRLDQLHSVGGSIQFFTHNALVDVELGNLSTVSGSIIMDSNYDNLTNLSFPELITVNSLKIWADELTLLDLPQLLSVGTNLRINAEKLTTLNTPQITNIGKLTIQETQLTDLFNFDHPVSIAGPLTLMDNPLLSTCNVQGICDYLANAGPANAQISNNAPGCNDEWGVYYNGCALLGVELITFDAHTQVRSIRLSWQTASELNNQGFEIQRSKDGTNWEKIGWEDGKGTSTSLQNYQYTDDTPILGNNYYRLKQIDVDGSFTYSKVVNAKYSTLIGTDINISPIPAKDILTLQFYNQHPTSVHIQISSFTGHVIHEIKLTTNGGLHTRTFNIANFPKGTYFLSASTGQYTQTKRFVKR